MYYLTTRNGEPLHFNFYRIRELLEPTEESLSQKDLVFAKQIKGIAISDQAYSKFTNQKLVDFTLRNFTVLRKYTGTLDYLIVRSEEGDGNDHLTLNQFLNNTIGYDENELCELSFVCTPDDTFYSPGLGFTDSLATAMIAKENELKELRVKIGSTIWIETIVKYSWAASNHFSVAPSNNKKKDDIVSVTRGLINNIIGKHKMVH